MLRFSRTAWSDQVLCRFRYFGVPDSVDYRNIPWRNSRFDEEELTRHADFMADFFKEQGMRAVAVHSGPTSANRAQSLEQLSAGHLDVICAVDVFNEGLDLPQLDTVLMLRPTESRILWLQQLGRGLRKTAGDKQLTVIDTIGNHRTFLLKPRDPRRSRLTLASRNHRLREDLGPSAEDPEALKAHLEMGSRPRHCCLMGEVGSCSSLASRDAVAAVPARVLGAAFPQWGVQIDHSTVLHDVEGSACLDGKTPRGRGGTFECRQRIGQVWIRNRQPRRSHGSPAPELSLETQPTLLRSAADVFDGGRPRR